MKASHQSYNRRGWRERLPPFATLFAFLFGILPLLLAAAALAAPVEKKGKAVLLGPLPGPCAGADLGPDYIGGADVYGHYTVPADLPSLTSVHLDSETVYSVVGKDRHHGGTEVAVNIAGIENLLDAPAACAPHL